MKPIAQLTEEEKALLLHQLFPDEIPPLLTYIQSVCTTIKERERQERESWNDGLFTFDFWLSQIKATDRVIKKYGKDLQRNSQLFAGQLYVGQVTAFTVHCLMLYTTTRKHPNIKFTQAIDLLFL